MSIQKNWWELTSCGSRFCENVILALSSGKSVVIKDSAIPWAETFYEKIKGANISASKAFEFIDGADFQRTGDPPGEFLFNKYCPPAVQSAYWPDTADYDHVNFLAQTNDILLNLRFIVVRNLASEKDFNAWFAFVEKYMKCCKADDIDPEMRALFILEYAGNPPMAANATEVSVLPFSPREVDVFTYNLVNFAKNDDDYLLNKYAAELIGELCGSSVENCGLLSEYASLLLDPLRTYASFTVNLSEQDCLSSEQLRFAVLTAQFKVLYPVIEQKRQEIIKQYYRAIQGCLPWQNDFGQMRNEPYDMELRDLLFLSGRIGIPEADKRLVRTLRDTRNQLAHNHILSYSEMRFLADL